uniref:Uncharacterized protein n=1 Tax=viral metagenome TaxID=1070528 RepID=A0A6C0ENW3_9ZZZZ
MIFMLIHLKILMEIGLIIKNLNQMTMIDIIKNNIYQMICMYGPI